MNTFANAKRTVWRLELQDLFDAVKPNTRCIFLNSPCNPTGWVMRPDEQRCLLDFCRDRNIWLIADEVYHRTVFDEQVAPSFLSIARDDDPVVIVSGFSKAWAMTGWRVGWVVAPAYATEQLGVMSECFNTGATTFVQIGAVTALEQGEEWVQRLALQYQAGRDITLEALAIIPASKCSAPKAPSTPSRVCAVSSPAWILLKVCSPRRTSGLHPVTPLVRAMNNTSGFALRSLTSACAKR